MCQCFGGTFSPARNAWAFKTHDYNYRTPTLGQVRALGHLCGIWLLKAEVVFPLKVFLFLKERVSFVLRIFHVVLYQLFIGRYPVYDKQTNSPKGIIYKLFMVAAALHMPTPNCLRTLPPFTEFCWTCQLNYTRIQWTPNFPFSQIQWPVNVPYSI